MQKYFELIKLNNFIIKLFLFKFSYRIIIKFLILNLKNLFFSYKIGDWGLGIGDWGLGIGDWELVLRPIPNPQSPIPNPQSPFK